MAEKLKIYLVYYNKKKRWIIMINIKTEKEIKLMEEAGDILKLVLKGIEENINPSNNTC